jgi:hypothetical protein
MSNGFRTTLLASALLTALTLASPPGSAARPAGAAPPATGELDALDRLAAALRSDLHLEQKRLDSACEFTEIRARLIRVRDEAVAAAERLGSLWRSGRLRPRGLAMSEVLVYDFAALIYEARRDTALADTLATLEEETRQGSAEARALFLRMVEIHPAAPACLSGALDEPERGDLAAVRALQRALSLDPVTDSLLVIRGLR